MLLSYTTWSLQHCPGELVWSLGMDITLDNMLMILDEHYNNVKALDALNQELFQLRMADKETISDWGVPSIQTSLGFSCFLPWLFSLPNRVSELKWDHFCGRLPKQLKAMVAYLKASPHEKTYSDYLSATREAEKEESMELSKSMEPSGGKCQRGWGSGKWRPGQYWQSYWRVYGMPCKGC